MWYEGLYPEQRTIADGIIKKGNVALFAQQGTGKTHIVLAVIEKFCPRLSLIVAPLTGIEITWQTRLSQLSGTVICRNFEELHSTLATSQAPECVVLLVHFQLFSKLSKKLARLAWDLAVIDESQGLKDRASGQSRAARRLRDAAAMRIALSGTPIDESPIDVWAQMRFVNHSVLGENWLTFAERFCEKAGYKGKQWVFRNEMMDQFLSILKPHIYRLTNEFMDLPPMTIYLIPVMLLGAQSRSYLEMETKGIVTLPDGSRTIARLPVTNKVKREQITGGFVINEDNESIRVGSAKERKLSALVDKIKDRPVVVFCQFLHEIDPVYDILTRSMKSVAVLYGEIRDKKNDKRRTKLLQDFQAGHIDGLICQMRTGGVSIDLTRSNTLIMYSTNHSFIDYEQILFRFHRGGQTKPVSVYVLYAINTVDEEKLEVLRNKHSTSYRVVSAFEGASNGKESEEDGRQEKGGQVKRQAAEKRNQIRRATTGQAHGRRGRNRSFAAS